MAFLDDTTAVTEAQSDGEAHDSSSGGRRLRLLSYNIQTGIATRRYREYVMHSWKHVFPHHGRADNLDRIAAFVGHYDIVGLQEVDGGSLRSGFINQTEYLALAARFPHWYDQRNRDLGKFAQHSLGVLSRFQPSAVKEVRLRGRIPGRGALVLRYGHGEDALHVVIMHLALSQRARLRQFEHVAEHLCGCRHIIVMGDFNCRSDSREMGWLLKNTGLREPIHGLHTFPSWRPAHNIDHILVSPSIEVRSTRVLNEAISDHLPIEMEIVLPEAARLGHLADAPASISAARAFAVA